MPPKKSPKKSPKQPSAPIPPVPVPPPSPSPEWVAARLELAADAVDEFVRAVTVNFDRDGDGYVSPPPFTVDYNPNPCMDAAWNTPSLLYRGVEYIAEILFAVGLTRHTGEKLAPHATHAWVSGGFWSCGEPWTKLAERIVPIGQGLAVRRAEYQAGVTDEASGLTIKRVPGAALDWATEISESLRAAAQSARGEKPAPPRPRGQASTGGSSEPKPAGPQFAHAADFSWIIWDGERYQIAKGQLAAIVGALWAEWEKSGRRNGCGLSEATLAEVAGSSNTKFRVVHVLRRYPELERIVKAAGKGKFALFSESHS